MDNNIYNYNTNTDTNYNYDIMIIIAAIIALIGAIVYNNNRTLNNTVYIQNTYLYVVLAIMLSALVIVLLEKIKFEPSNGLFLASFCIALIIICAYAFTSKESIVLRHIYYLLFAIAFGIMLYPQVMFAKDNNTLIEVIITVLAIVVGLTIVTNYVPIDTFDSWGPYLGVSLFALIIFELVDLLFNGVGVVESGRGKIYSIIAIILFSCFIMYDTKKIDQRAYSAIECVKSNMGSLEGCTDYTLGSLSVYLDIVNLFSNTNYIMS